MNISYTKKGDYLLPDLILENKKQYNIGKYGLLRLNILRKKSLMFISLNLRKKNLNEKALNKPSISRWKSIDFRKGTFLPLSSSKWNNYPPSRRKRLKTSGNSLKSNPDIRLTYLIKYKYVFG